MENRFKRMSSYIDGYLELLSLCKKDFKTIDKIIQKLITIKKKNKRVFIVGNGGSAAIASHFSVDLTLNCNIRCLNFNDSDLITCFANDFGYENWVKKAIELYGEKGDLLIAISSSGKSQNIINGCKAAKSKSFLSTITFTGFDYKNSVKKIGDINFWVNSKKYNYIENLHQIILLMAVDLLKKY